ncbi:MAG: hypothetical protein EOP83_34330 [Verrucomicrobiaceae bacterium]|nr:MAG: hypothetical protein EOP83_34330 [Verrucomicrobiaceae bacterium]
MSVAEKLIARGEQLGLHKGIAQGRQEGREEGAWIGKIQAFEEFLGRQPTPVNALESLTLEDLQRRHEELRGEYDRKFRR